MFDLFASQAVRLIGERGAVAAFALTLSDELRGTNGLHQLRRLPSAAGSELPIGLAELASLDAQAPPLILLALGAAAAELATALRLLARRGDVAVVTDVACPEAEQLLVVETDGTVTAYRAPGAELHDAPTTSFLRPSRPVTVGVLGRVVIEGVDGDLGRHPKLTELITYLAMHPDGSLSRIWTAALWPERRVPQQTVANRLSEARRFLGLGPDGLPRLGRNGERHRLRHVRTDWGQFQELSSAASVPSDWRAALDLVRGRPFEDLQEGQWSVLEGFVGEMEEAIAEVALRMGSHALDSGDADQAVWAARQALRAAPFDERLHRLLMRAADRAGNRAGIEGVLRQLALILEIDGDPLAAVHPETADLYQQLSGREHPLASR